MRIDAIVVMLVSGLAAISTPMLHASGEGNSGLARAVTNGGFESPVDPRPNAGVARIDDWLASSKACACRPSTKSSDRISAKKQFPPATQGKQCAMMILREKAVHATWLYQPLGTVGKADIGKSYVLSADVGSRYQNPDKWATMAVGLRANVTKTSLGDLLGDIARLPTGNGRRLRTVAASFTPTKADIGKKVSAVICLTGMAIKSGSDQYLVDNVQLKVVPAGDLAATLARFPATPTTLVCDRLWKERKARPNDMMKRYLFDRLSEAEEKWRSDYEKRQTPEQIAEYQKRLRAKFVEAVGGFPERCDLNPQITGTLERDGYRVEKIIFESEPNHRVTAAAFMPDPAKHKPPYPGIIVPCGHSSIGKGYAVYQKACALAALNGMVAMIFDPIDQGERHQLLDAKGMARLQSCPGHNMVGAGSMLLGRNTARYEIWDGMRAIDYLQSRADIDPKRIGCMGNSGGGTQTAYLMALDERIVCAAPSCYICRLFDRLLRKNGAQDAEQNIFGQLAFGMDHPDYCMMRAPKPTLLCTATKDFFNIEDAWTTYRFAKRLYTRLGFAERMNLVETDESHGFSLRLREGAVRWMLRWLADRDDAVTEPADLKILSDQEIQCTPKGEVMLLDGERSVYDLNRDYAKQLAGERKRLWSSTPREKLLERVRRLAGIREAGDLPKLEAEKLGTKSRDGYRIEEYLLVPEPGIWLPALLYVPEGSRPKGAVICLHERGKDAIGQQAVELVKAGRIALAVDLRGTGETQQVGQRYFSPAHHGPDGQDFYMAYHLGRTYVGMRAEDLVMCARWLAANDAAGKPSNVALVAVGHMSVPALHASALEPGLFGAVKLRRSLTSWDSVVQLGFVKTPYTSMVHGALKVYDLPDLARILGDRLTVEQPLNALRLPATGSK